MVNELLTSSLREASTLSRIGGGQPGVGVPSVSGSLEVNGQIPLLESCHGVCRLSC